MRPDINKVPSFYKRYIEHVESDDIVENLKNGRANLLSVYENFSEEDANYTYQMGKWTLKEILMHLIDTERVMTYRAMRFARQDQTELPGFDQDVFIQNIDASAYRLKDLLEEYKAVRQATIQLFKNMPASLLTQSGVASGYPIDVLTLAFIVPGHEKHHLGVIGERYDGVWG